MATEALANGNYAQHNGYPIDQAHNNHFPGQTAYSQGPPSNTSATPSQTNNQNSDIPKDEVGWYFVEQYYTTLSKNPDRLYLYYNKRSQFVSGNETDKVQVCVGQRAINDRIKDLDFQDCKVRITNVDSQASDQNIVIQVIGEISNKSQPHRKFTQTFVLGTQTNGYFVLNDIFRYIIEEEDEVKPETGEVVEEQVPEQKPAKPETAVKTASEIKTLASSSDPAAGAQDAAEVSKGTEKKLVNGDKPAHKAAEKAPVPKAEAKTSEKPELPTEPEPTPLPSPPKQQAAQPAAASKPSGPKTWASMAASANKSAVPNKAAVPAIPAQKSAPSTKTSTTQASAAANNNAAATTAQPDTSSNATAAPAAASEDASATAGDSQDEWTAVGSSHTRQQSRQVNNNQQQQQQQDLPQHRGYIKNVREGVSGPALKEALEKFGKVIYFDIAQQKNCAFVDFETAEGYQAAVDANPHVIGNDSFSVEERKMRPGSTPYVPRGQYQRGRGRGGFAPRGRGQGAGRGARGGAAQ